MKFDITLSNRGILLGLTTVPELLALAARSWRSARAVARGQPGTPRPPRWAFRRRSAVPRHLWTTGDTPFDGAYLRFGPVTLQPKPLPSPCPIWLTTNAGRLGGDRVGAGGSDFAPRRVGRVADGWMTHSVSPEGFRQSLDVIRDADRAAGRDMDGFGTILTAIINIQDDTDAAVADATRYLKLYYGARYTPEPLHAWGPIGTPAQYAAWIRGFYGSGCEGFTLRFATMGDATSQA